MYSYVSKSESKPFRIFCSDKLNKLKQDLKNNQIDIDFYLIGSGMKNLITRNGQEAFDLDYNIEFKNFSISKLEPKKTKKYIMDFLNEIITNENLVFKNCQDSTSSITAKYIYNGKLEFSFDIAILAKNNDGNYCRLIHNKKNAIDSYHWDKIPKSRRIYKKFEKLKENGFFLELKEIYLMKKNYYLTHNDHYHSSFTIFKETVNQMYNKYYRS